MTDDRSRPTLGDVSHTHPDTDEAFGTAMAYKRGPVVAADGGKRDGVDGDVPENGGESEDDTGGADDERMRDVDHAPPNGNEVNRVHQRGGEGRSGR